MKKNSALSLVLAVVLVLAMAGIGRAGNTATQTVTFEILPINELAVSGSPATLTVSTATAGSEPNAATNATTTYRITTNVTGKKITGKIDSAMPSGTTLQINLAAPTGGTSAGDVTLSTTDQDLVTGLTLSLVTGETITYTFSATTEAGTLTAESRTVTLTLTGP